MRKALLLAGGLLAAACSPQPQPAPQAQEGVAVYNSVPGPIVEKKAPEPPPPIIVARAEALPAAPDGALTMDGWGPIRIGMTLEELNAATGSKLTVPTDPSDEESGCTFLYPQGIPRGVSVMFLQSAVARIDVDEPGVPTYGGLEVGSFVADARRVFGAALDERPHFYSGLPSRYLTAWTIAPNSLTDGRGESVDPFDVWIKTRGLRFETDDVGKITTFRAGSGAIEMVEGCQ